MAESKKTHFAKQSILNIFLSWIARMGQNFDDYPSFQPKITQPKHFSPQCSTGVVERLTDKSDKKSNT